MSNHEIIVLIDGLGNVSFEKVDKDCLADYLLEKESDSYLFSVVTNVKPTKDNKLVFDIYDGECYED